MAVQSSSDRTDLRLAKRRQGRTLGRGDLAERLERRAHLAGKQIGLLPGGEVAALVDLVEVTEVGIGRLDPAARGSPEFAGERGEADQDLDVRGSLAGRSGLAVPARPPSTTAPPRRRCPSASTA